MWRRAIRQRRRLALCFLLGAAAGALVSAGRPGGIMPGTLAGGVALAGLSAAIVMAAPGWRWFALKLAVVAFVAALVWRLSGTPPPATALVAAGAVLLLPSQPAFLDRLRVPFITRARVERRFAVPAAGLWEALLPKETDWHWDPHVQAVRPGKDPGVFVYAHRALGGERGVELPVRVFDVEDGHFKLRDLSLPGAGQGGPVTVTSHTIEPDGAGSDGGARLTLMEASWRQGLWTAFALWLDDYLADHVDRMAALLEGRRDWSVRGAVLRFARQQARGGQRPGRRKPTRS